MSTTDDRIRALAARLFPSVLAGTPRGEIDEYECSTSDPKPCVAVWRPSNVPTDEEPAGDGATPEAAREALLADLTARVRARIAADQLALAAVTGVATDAPTVARAERDACVDVCLRYAADRTEGARRAQDEDDDTDTEVARAEYRRAEAAQQLASLLHARGAQ